MKQILFAIALLFTSFSFAAGPGYDELTPAQRQVIDQQTQKFNKANGYSTGTKDYNPNDPILKTPSREEVESSKYYVPSEKPVEKLKVVQAWAEAGAQLGAALANAAKELGVAANDFVKTPVGIMTAGIIIYKYVGKDLIRFGVYIVGGIVYFIVYMILWWILVRRFVLIKSIAYVDHEAKLPWSTITYTKRRKEITYNTYQSMAAEQVAFTFMSLIVGIGSTALIIFNY